MELLRLSTAGSVDDGKSTLIGRLLWENRAIPGDRLAAIERASKSRGAAHIDLALLTDGLRAEREQGITIDVAHHFFTTGKRKFIIADTPGHAQYTRNMATGMSTAEVALLLVDAARGLSLQSKRHAFITSLLQVPHVAVLINKMDLVDFDEAVFRRIRDEYLEFAEKLSIKDLTFIPVSALEGDNVVQRSKRLDWYSGAPVLKWLEDVPVGSSRNLVDFRLPVQLVFRPNAEFRGYAGRISSGTVAPGERVVVLPSGQRSRVTRVLISGEERSVAAAGDSIVLQLEHDIDVSRGDLIVRERNLPQGSADLDSMLVWLDELPMDPRRTYVLQHGTRRLQARISELTYAVDIQTLHRKEASALEVNEIGRVTVSTSGKLFFDPYALNRETGSFILIDPSNNRTVAAGMIRRAATSVSRLVSQDGRRSPNVRVEQTGVERKEREAKNAHRAVVVWLTGLPGSGKSTIARALERRLFEAGAHAIMLDGDNLRHNLCGDLGFDASDRRENIRRVSEVARMMFEAGQVVICSLVSPYREDRERARDLVPPGRFMEVYVDCDLETAKSRDPKGLYKKALEGEIKDFTGISAPYEAPANPEVYTNSRDQSVEESVQTVFDALRALGAIPER